MTIEREKEIEKLRQRLAIEEAHGEKYQRELTELRRQLEECRKDAERYRHIRVNLDDNWLGQYFNCVNGGYSLKQSADLDAAIDAAIAGEKK